MDPITVVEQYFSEVYERRDSAEFATVCFNLHFAGGTMSGIEVFRVIDDRIVETWNSTVQPNRWG